MLPPTQYEPQVLPLAQYEPPVLPLARYEPPVSSLARYEPPELSLVPMYTSSAHPLYAMLHQWTSHTMFVVSITGEQVMCVENRVNMLPLNFPHTSPAHPKTKVPGGIPDLCT